MAPTTIPIIAPIASPVLAFVVTGDGQILPLDEPLPVVNDIEYLPT